MKTSTLPHIALIRLILKEIDRHLPEKGGSYRRVTSPEGRYIMQQIKSLLNPKIVIPVASVLVFLVAGTLVTIFYIRERELKRWQEIKTAENIEQSRNLNDTLIAEVYEMSSSEMRIQEAFKMSFGSRNPTVATSLFTHDGESTTTSNEGEHRTTEALKPGGAAGNSMTTSARVVIQSLTTMLSTPSHLETSTVLTAGSVSDPNLDNSANTVHAIEPTKRE